MQQVLFLSVLWLSFLQPVYAADRAAAPHNIPVSKTHQNVFVAFDGSPGKLTTSNEAAVFPVHKQIRYGFGSALPVPFDVLTLGEEYGCMMTATSDSGQIVRKTKEGKKWGKMFFDVVGFNRKQLDYAKGRGSGGFQSPYLSTATTEVATFSRSLPPLDSLFRFEKPGKYSVSIYLQCFVGPFGQSCATNVTLVRFPPVSVQVVKE